MTRSSNNYGKPSWQPETWYVDGINDLIVRKRNKVDKNGEPIISIAKAWLSQSFGGHKILGRFSKGIGCRRKKWKGLDETQVFIYFTGYWQKFTNRYFQIPNASFNGFIFAAGECLENYKYGKGKNPESAKRALAKIRNSDWDLDTKNLPVSWGTLHRRCNVTKLQKL